MLNKQARQAAGDVAQTGFALKEQMKLTSTEPIIQYHSDTDNPEPRVELRISMPRKAAKRMLLFMSRPEEWFKAEPLHSLRLPLNVRQFVRNQIFKEPAK